jgi:hypothetical protein
MRSELLTVLDLVQLSQHTVMSVPYILSTVHPLIVAIVINTIKFVSDSHITRHLLHTTHLSKALQTLLECFRLLLTLCFSKIDLLARLYFLKHHAHRLLFFLLRLLLLRGYRIARWGPWGGTVNISYCGCPFTA